MTIQTTPPEKARLGSADIAAILRREILNGVRIANEKMPAERALAAQFNVSRGTVREALAQLARENLVEIRAGSGAYITYDADAKSVSAIENARPLELIDARFALEPHICRLAILHATRADFEIFERLLLRMEACVSDPVGFAAADSEFHAALANSTGNNLLIWIANQINAVFSLEEWTRMRRLTLNESTIRKYNAQHRAIVNAIRARDPEEAARVMKQHLEVARLSLTRVAAT